MEDLILLTIVGIIALALFPIALIAAGVAGGLASALYPLLLLAKLFGWVHMSWLVAIFSPIVFAFNGFTWVYGWVF